MFDLYHIISAEGKYAINSGKIMKLKKYSPYIIAFCATIIRYYDYAIFGLSAAMISKNFMPGAEDGDQMLVFFAIFSIAMLARPLGSIIFGKIGDKVSRVASVKISMILAAVSTGLIAIIPSFESIGWFAVILLTLCRMLFLVSLAGEIDAIKIYVAEKIGKKKRHLAIGIVSFSSQLGVLLASVMYHLAISFEDMQWLWKMNFFLGGIFGLFVIMMRNLLQESDSFLKSKSRIIDDVDSSVFSIIARNKVKFMLAVLINGMLGGGYHFFIIFLGTFAANVADVISPEQAAYGNIGVIALYGTACVLSGYLSDRIHITKQTVVALTCSIFCVLIMEFMLSLGIFAGYLHYMIAFTAPFYAVPCAIKMQSLFATNIRMRMFSLSHSLGSLIFSSTTPFICMLIWRWTESFALVLAYFLVQLVVLFFALFVVARKDYINMFET